MIILLSLITILCFYLSGLYSAKLIQDEADGLKLEIKDIFWAVSCFMLGLLDLITLIGKASNG